MVVARHYHQHNLTRDHDLKFATTTDHDQKMMMATDHDLKMMMARADGQ